MENFTANNLWMMICTALVFFMHLGFGLLEAGLTRQKNTLNILFKNIFIITSGLLLYYIIGFNLMYPGDFNGFLGSFIPGIAPPENGMTPEYANGGYTWWTDFLFQGMFAATAATIVSGAVAERIKTFHGGVVATGMDDREMIEVGGETGDWEHDRRTISRAELIGIIRPRMEEILEEARVRLDAAGFEHLPSQQIVLTGGASQMPGLDTLAPRILGQQVRIGRPLRVHGLPQAATGSAFSAAVGLSLFAAHPQDEWWDFEIPNDRHAPRSLKRAVKWFKDNW